MQYARHNKIFAHAKYVHIVNENKIIQYKKMCAKIFADDNYIKIY